MDAKLRRVVREELLRSIAWIGLGLVGWPVLADEVAWLETTVFTVFGLPVLTWAGLTAAMVGLRVLTDSELRVRSAAGLTVSLVFGVMLGGVGAVYLVTAGGYPALWVATGYAAVTLVTLLWYWYAGVPAAERESTA